MKKIFQAILFLFVLNSFTVADELKSRLQLNVNGHQHFLQDSLFDKISKTWEEHI